MWNTWQSMNYFWPKYKRPTSNSLMPASLESKHTFLSSKGSRHLNLWSIKELKVFSNKLWFSIESTSKEALLRMRSIPLSSNRSLRSCNASEKNKNLRIFCKEKNALSRRSARSFSETLMAKRNSTDNK